LLLASQLLDGITGATITILTTLVITDLTTGTGRFNLTQGVVGTLTGLAAALSTMITGLLAHQFGDAPSFLILAATTGLAFGILLLFLQETKPQKYLD